MGKPTILCVDDEEAVLEGLELSLRRSYRVVSATSGQDGLARLEDAGPFPIVISDMRMPGMDGAQFLTEVRKRSPGTMRILLTGQADMAAAISAVNEGQVFRFLTKPCPGKQLLPVLDDAMEVHTLRAAEKQLLEQTLRGSIKALTDLLAMTHPMVFGRSMRVAGLISRMVQPLSVEPSWPIEIAAMTCQVGHVALDDETADRLYQGRLPAADRVRLAERNFDTVSVLLGRIPRMEPVMEILRQVFAPRRGEQRDKEAQMLSAAIEYDLMTSRNVLPTKAIAALRTKGHYSSFVIDQLDTAGRAAGTEQTQQMRLRDVRPGMVFAQDVRTSSGLLLLARGFKMTESFVRKAAGFRPDYVDEPVWVIVPG